MKLSIVILLFCFVSVSFAQKQETHPWDLGCDTMHTQADMNICSFESFQIADSILSKLYIDIIHQLEVKYDSALLNIQAPNTDFLKTVRQQLCLIRQSKNLFLAMRKAKIQAVSLYYEGGTILPLVVNTIALEITISQIAIVQKLKKELSY